MLKCGLVALFARRIFVPYPGIMAFQKVDKEFVLSDSSTNVYGYRLMTSGYMMEEFKKNPIGYYMHKKEDGVLVKWEDLRLDGDQLLGKPSINLEHPRGARTVTEVADGFLNAASVGKLVFVDFELADNPDNKEEPLLVVTKWYNRECSLVDNPGNRNAMKVELADEEGNEISLADVRQVHIDILKNKQNEMKSITLKTTPELLAMLSLSDEDATAENVEAGIKDLHEENKALTAKNGTLVTELADERSTIATEKVKGILDAALGVGKINAKTRAKLETQFAGKPAELADLVGDMPAYAPLGERLNVLPDVVKDLADKTYQEIDKAGKVALLKKEAPGLYDQKLAEFKASRKK